MSMIRGWPALMALTVLLGACAPAGGRETAGADATQTGAAQTRVLNVIGRVEPPTMLDATANRYILHKAMFTANLGNWNLQGAPNPVLAASAPQLNTDTWRVFPDGRMETVFRLRPGLKWHDGTPLTAEDFAFRHRVDLKRAEWTGVVDAGAEREIAEIEARDAQTVVISWKTPFFEAAAPDLSPYPRHLLEGLLDRDSKELWDKDSYWTSDYVHAGPYRLERWERGGFMEGVAFEGFALGPPKIQRIRVTWNGDSNVGLTRLLSGAADLSLDNGIQIPQATILKQHWTSENIGTIMLNPSSLRYIWVQHRPDYVSPGALLDVRVRQAILHALDRPAIAEVVLNDSSLFADTVPPRSVSYYPDVDRAVRKYPFDPARSAQLMAEAGFPKGPDGGFISPSEGRFQVEIRGSPVGQEELDTTIVQSYLQKAGMEADINWIDPIARAQAGTVANDILEKFPGLFVNNTTLQRGLGLTKWVSTSSPRGNRFGYVNPEFNRLQRDYVTTLEPREQVRSLVEMMRILSEDLPTLPLYYDVQVVAHTAAIRGPEPITPDNTQYGNVHLWEWR